MKEDTKRKGSKKSCTWYPPLKIYGLIIFTCNWIAFPRNTRYLASGNQTHLYLLANIVQSLDVYGINASYVDNSLGAYCVWTKSTVGAWNKFQLYSMSTTLFVWKNVMKQWTLIFKCTVGQWRYFTCYMSVQ